ncbi:MAG: transporter substrate-binding domain-containing protein, partial [Vibrio sp.]
MNKILLASLIGLVSASAAAQQEIKFVMEATYAPFEYMDANNQIQGFDVDLANALCKQLQAKWPVARRQLRQHSRAPWHDPA